MFNRCSFGFDVGYKCLICVPCCLICLHLVLIMNATLSIRVLSVFTSYVLSGFGMLLTEFMCGLSHAQYRLGFDRRLVCCLCVQVFCARIFVVLCSASGVMLNSNHSLNIATIAQTVL